MDHNIQKSSPIKAEDENPDQYFSHIASESGYSVLSRVEFRLILIFHDRSLKNTVRSKIRTGKYGVSSCLILFHTQSYTQSYLYQQTFLLLR